ncbi:terminase large subunit [Caudoviricetes sp.]|nr:terminase large subunit [Caudoviricetes sp.]
MGITVNQKVNIGWKPLFIKRNGVRYIILMGGRGAGRSYVASQFGTSKIIAPEYFRCAIMRLVHEDIRNSIWQELVDRVEDQGITEHIKIINNDMKMKFTVRKKDGTTFTNSINALGFTSSGKRSAKLKSLASYNTVIIEEAEEIGEAEFMQLDDSLRTVQGDITVVLCLNTPPRSHWIIKKWFNLEPAFIDGELVDGFTRPVLKPECAEDTEFLYFNFRSNITNLDPHTVKRYLAYKDTKPAYYYHMIEGLCPDIVRGRIYSGWKLIDSVPHEARLVGRGLDFGWFPDPLHLCNVYFYNGGYILDQLLHGNYIKNETVAHTIKQDEIDNQRALTIADSAEPKSIEDIAEAGVSIVGVDKGKGSVEHRIKTVSGLRISVTRRSTKLWEGYETYAWKEDKDGNSLGVPAHPGSDPMDASGYCLVSVVDNMDPEEESKVIAKHIVTKQQFVQATSNRYGL